MLRFFALLLLLANLGFYSWTQGWLDPLVGVSPRGDREPERFARQVNPEIVRILPPSGTTPVSARPGEPAERVMACLEAGPFSPAQLPQAEAALAQALPGLAYATHPGERAGEQRLRVPRADAATAARLSALRLDALGRGFGACSAG